MSIVHVGRIENRLREEYFNKIDCSDLKPKLRTNDTILSRSQAALAISCVAEINSDQAIRTITDGFKDNGLDAIHIDKDLKTLFLLQSKWVKDGNSTPDKSDLLKFLEGVNDLIETKFDKFHERIIARKDEIIEVLKDASFNVELIIVYTGSQKISDECIRLLDDRMFKLNDSSEIFSYKILDQKFLYKAILSGSEGSPIDLSNITLHNWGKHNEPYESVYGEIEAEKISELWDKHGQNLLTKNLRQFKGITSVNVGIKNTLSKNPEDFWYFNNGITALCKDINKGAIHGTDKAAGVFTFKDVSLVNGAQTYGNIGETYKTHADEVRKAKVQIRFINLKDAPIDYATKITRYNNTQNKIESKDFASLDPEQQRIKNELFLEYIAYSYKTGEDQPEPGKGFDLEEATIALGCAHSDIHYTVIVNREIGSIWEDISKIPYKALFNKDTNVLKLWKCVQIMRIVEEFLREKENKQIGNDRNIAIHGNRFILHTVYKRFGYGKLANYDKKISKSELKPILNTVFNATEKILKEMFPDDFLYTFFKNQTKTYSLSNKVDVEIGLSNELFKKEHFR